MEKECCCQNCNCENKENCKEENKNDTEGLYEESFDWDAWSDKLKQRLEKNKTGKTHRIYSDPWGEYRNNFLGVLKKRFPDLNADNVNHPKHYNIGKYECKDVMIDIFGDEWTEHFYLLNAFKYLYRCRHKGHYTEDIRKAYTYLGMILEGLNDGTDE